MTLITLAVDGNPKTNAAIRWAARRAAADESTVNVVSVATDTGPVRDASERAVAEAAAELRRLEPALAVAASVTSGAVFDELQLLSRDCDLLIVGSDRPDPVRSFFHATLPMRLAGQSHCDLVVVPAQWNRAQNGAVVVGWSPDPVGAVALQSAAREAEATGEPLVIVHAWAPVATSAYDAESAGALITAIREDAERTLREATETARRDHPRLAVASKLHLGTVTGGLTTQGDAALIVVGGHRHTALSEMLLDPTGDALIRKVRNVPILIAHGAPRTDEQTSEVSRHD